MATVIGLNDMRHDLADYLPEMSWREKLGTWLRFYCKATSWAVDPIITRLDLRRFGPLPPIEKDRVAHHFGFVEGIPACTDGPVCAAHGWPPSPLVEEQYDPDPDWRTD